MAVEALCIDFEQDLDGVTCPLGYCVLFQLKEVSREETQNRPEKLQRLEA
jgi:hypothetical protein